jgi:hypothetical protein
MVQVMYAIGTMVVAIVLLLLYPDAIGAALALVEISTALVFAAALFPPGLDHADFGDVLFLVSLPFLLGFGVETLLSLAGFVPINAAGNIAADPLQFTFDQDSLRALTLAVISWGVLFVGYRLRIGDAISARLPNPSLAVVDPGSIRMATVVFAAVGWSARIAVMVQGSGVDASSGLESVNALSTLLLWLSFLTTVASTLALYSVFFRRADPASVLLAVGLVAGELAAGFITGSRTLVFTPLVGAAAMAYLTGRYHLRLRHLLVIPALLLVIGVTDTYRNPGLISGSNVDAADTGARVQLVMEESVDQGPVQLAYRGALNLALRYQGLYSVAQILRVGPPSDLSYGTSYVMAVPAALVPRFLWPDKPFPTLGVDFGRRYLGVPDNVAVSIAPTWLGDLLLNVPLFVVPIAMGLIGVLLRAFRGYGLRARGGTTFAVLVYPLLLPILFQSDGWISGAVWATTQAIAVLVVAFALIRSERPATTGQRLQGSATLGQRGRDAGGVLRRLEK